MNMENLNTNNHKLKMQAFFGFYNFAVLKIYDNKKFVVKELFLTLEEAEKCLERNYKNENALVVKPKFIVSSSFVDSEFDLQNVDQFYKVKFKDCDIREFIAGVELVEFDEYFSAV